ncbi:hypothetical protein I4U23_012662 [Adineta vaga]|nr:hypothetical protein I4U23_012662 [Adineta vaga]
MESVPLIMQKNIVTDFNRILNGFCGLNLTVCLLQFFKLLIHINSLRNQCEDLFWATYFVNSYFTDGGLVTEIFIPLLRTIKTWILIWLVFKGTTYDHVYYSTIKSMIEEEERITSELQNPPENTSDDEDSITDNGTSPMEDEFGISPMEEDPLMIADIDEH